MPFSKAAGLRLTDIQMESGTNLVQFYGKGTHIFKIETLFSNQTLNIKNCVIEIEIFEE